MASHADIEAGPAFSPAPLVAADKVRGTAVHGRDGDKLGTVDRFIVDKRSGQVAYVILLSGRFLGMGGSLHPVPWAAFRYDEQDDSYAVAIDKRLLDGAPGYSLDSAPLFDAAYGQRVTEYYRLSLQN